MQKLDSPACRACRIRPCRPRPIVALLLAKYAFLGIVPLVIPSIAFDVPIPTNRIPTQQGDDLEYIRLLAARVGYVFYLDPGPAPGMSIGVLGAAVKVGVPQPALNTDMDAAQQRREPQLQLQRQRAQLAGRLHPERADQGAAADPDSGHRPAQSAARPDRSAAAAISPAAGNGEIFAGARAVAGHGRGGQIRRYRDREGSLDVTRYGRVLKPRQLVGVRGVGPAFDGLHYVSQVRHTIKRGEYKQSFELSRNGLLSTVPHGAVMNKFHGKYRGTVVNNVDPEQRGRIQALVPDVSGLIPSSWAMPCVPFAGKQSGVYVVPQIGAGVWIEFEQGDPDYPIWVGGFWGVGRGTACAGAGG